MGLSLCRRLGPSVGRRLWWGDRLFFLGGGIYGLVGVEKGEGESS